jgi:hypothetical protein
MCNRRTESGSERVNASESTEDSHLEVKNGGGVRNTELGYVEKEVMARLVRSGQKLVGQTCWREIEAFAGRY